MCPPFRGVLNPEPFKNSKEEGEKKSGFFSLQKTRWGEKPFQGGKPVSSLGGSLTKKTQAAKKKSQNGKEATRDGPAPHGGTKPHKDPMCFPGKGNPLGNPWEAPRVGNPLGVCGETQSGPSPLVGEFLLTWPSLPNPPTGPKGPPKFQQKGLRNNLRNPGGKKKGALKENLSPGCPLEPFNIKLMTPKPGNRGKVWARFPQSWPFPWVVPNSL